MNKYELLYEWLKRTNERDWKPALSKVVSRPDVPFDQWLEENSESIEDLKDHRDLYGLRVIEDEDEFNRFHDPEMATALCVFVDLFMPKDRLIEQFRQLLKEHHAGKVGRPKHEAQSEFEWCEISGELTLQSLEVMLTVYDLRQKTSLKLWQIGEMANINPSQHTMADDPHDVLVSKKAVLNSTVSRYLTWADTLIENLEQGRFPKYKKEKEPKLL